MKHITPDQEYDIRMITDQHKYSQITVDTVNKVRSDLFNYMRELNYKGKQLYSNDRVVFNWTVYHNPVWPSEIICFPETF